MDKQLQAQLASFQTLTTNAEASYKPKQDTEEDRKVVNYIFHKIQAICPAWQHSLGKMSEEEKQQLLKTMKREWLNELMDRKINQQHLIDYALKRLKGTSNPFFPAVGQFIEWCEEGKLPEGTTGTLESYKEILGYLVKPAKNRELIDLRPETYATMIGIQDFYTFRHADTKRSKEIWFQAHDKTLQDMKDGKDIPVAPKPVEKLEQIRVAGKRSTMMDAMKSMRDGL